MKARLLGGLGLVALIALVGCGSSPKDSKDAHDIAVGKAAGAHPGGVAPRPCDPTQGTTLDADHAEGTRITELCFLGGSNEAREEVRKALSLAPGKTLTADALRADLAAAWKTGSIDQIEATARLVGSGSTLFFTIQERPRVTATSFEGVTALAGDAVLQGFPKPGARLDRALLSTQSQKMVDAYASRGFDRASVTPQITPDGNDSVKVRIFAVEGSRAKIGTVTFAGVHGGRDADLRKAIELQDGAPFVEEQVARAILLVAAFYYDRGFMNVRVESPKKTRAADGTTALVVPISEGPVFRIGKVKIAKVDAATEKDILATMKVKPGEVFNRSKLKADLEAIETKSKQSGKPVSVEPLTNLDVKKGVVDLTLEVKDRS